MEENQWARVTELFDRLLAGEPPEPIFSSEPDPAVREAARQLWLDHIRASQSDFLGRGIGFEVIPVFTPGQLLVNRFRIEKLLGKGGMGEVYLALDNRIGEQVAIKTIVRLLASSAAFRKRIVAEVQNARRVTHPHVCRIHELFDEGNTVFFSMEYVAGVLLSDVEANAIGRKSAREILRQMAEGLHAAHVTGVVHGDFKPSNVILSGGDRPRAVIMDFGLARAADGAGPGFAQTPSLQAGTVDYMAPELAQGLPPSVRSDIFAFGRVGERFLPGERIWQDCTQTKPENRPASLEPVIRWLQPSTSRRNWLAGLAIAAAGSGSFLFNSIYRKPFPLTSKDRLLVNGFRPTAGQIEGSRLARSIMLTALRQSPRLHVIDDRDAMPVLRRLVANSSLPVEGQTLRELLTRLSASYWLDADISRNGGRYSLILRLFSSHDGQHVAESSIRDMPGVIALAQQAALWLRTSAGESQQSLAVDSVVVPNYTSQVPEALEKYYDAMDHYAVADIPPARLLLQQAVRLDPAFAQAHSMLGLFSISSDNYEDSFREVELGMKLAAKLPEREKAWIEENYFNFTQDMEKMLDAARRDVVYYPDEPRFCRLLARALCRAGKSEESIPWNRKAVQLSPDEPLLRTELIENLCQASRFTESIEEYQSALNAGMTNGWLHADVARSYTALERYSDAIAAYEKAPSHPLNVRDIQGVKALQGKFEVAASVMREQSTAAKGSRDLHIAHEYLTGLYYFQDRPDLARDSLQKMVDLPLYPVMARRLECTAFWAARIGEDTVLANARQNVSQIAARWANSTTLAVDRAHRRLAGLALESHGRSRAPPARIPRHGLQYSDSFRCGRFLYCAAQPVPRRRTLGAVRSPKGGSVQLLFPRHHPHELAQPRGCRSKAARRPDSSKIFPKNSLHNVRRLPAFALYPGSE
jgi:serine/threonine protein kinase